jgi:carboxypeptidase Taq
MKDDDFDRLRTLLGHVHDLRQAAAVLEWDQETQMPPGGAEARARQLATLRRLAHERFTSDEVGALLDKLNCNNGSPLSLEASLLRVARRDYERARRLPADLVADLAEAAATGKQAWKRARENDDFNHFAPHLERLVALSQRKADALAPLFENERRYDALLDEYEPGMTTAEVERVFEPLRKELVPIVDAIREQNGPDASLLTRSYDEDEQIRFGEAVIETFGYDFERGRQDRSAHPFTTTFSTGDVRITTRTDPHDLRPALFGTLHEAGHALYEQGVDADLDGTLLANGTSLGLHESQSRLWENHVGRSRPFWEHYFPKLQDHFPNALDDVSASAFYRAVNRVEPSLIRVEADEVTYPLHVMLRFDLEKALIEDDLPVAELPDRWNAKMRDYLGVEPPNNAEGVLQDIHWSQGAFGYFPTYALGTLMAAQLFAQAESDLTDLRGQIGDSAFGELRDWLRQRVHRFGRKKRATDVLLDATGEALSPAPWLNYVRRKFGAIYELPG